ncbi:unnamed protein product [Alternaria alternata]
MIPGIAEATVGEVVAIKVGPAETVFRIHKDALCRESEYFRAAYNGRWKEAEEGLTLDDVEVGVFKTFVHWLYKQQLPQHGDVIYDADVDPEGPDYNVEYDMMLLKAYVFANRFLIADYERIVHNLFIDHIFDCECAMYKQIIFAYENLPKDSLILEPMVETQCLYWSTTLDNEVETQSRLDLPKEFFIQVMVRFAELRDRRIGSKEFGLEDFYMKGAD